MSRVLLIIGGGIAAYKAAELIRLLRKEGHAVTPVLTEGGSHFVTPMSLAALAESPVYTSLWDLKDEAEMGHIQLSRAADLVLVAPATADLLARMAGGQADDLATTLLLATDKPVVVAPAMNVRMWQHAATRRNIEKLKDDGITVLEPDEGPMACGEYGPGRLPEPVDIYDRLKKILPELVSGRGTAEGGGGASSHVETLLSALTPGAGLVTIADAAPASLSWLGGVLGQRVAPLGVDRFGQTGNLADLYAAYRLDGAAITEAAAELLAPFRL
jgi:phosphopantothenoylcysteine decarboxylase / phosphopantothenate---cysteine ligase